MLITRPYILVVLILLTHLAGKMPRPFETTRERRIHKPIACEPQRVREQDFGYLRNRVARVRC